MSDMSEANRVSSHVKATPFTVHFMHQAVFGERALVDSTAQNRENSIKLRMSVV
jgi:hypothetical protein